MEKNGMRLIGRVGCGCYRQKVKIADMRNFTIVFILLLPILLFAGCGKETQKPRTTREIIEELVVDYGNYGEKALPHVENLLTELKSADADLGARWEEIVSLWKSVNHDQTLYYDVLPDDLPDTDELCLVVLGFQLEPDGTMRDELIKRLTVALNSARKYPNSYIVCTGGGTAPKNKSATEAGEMAKWLIENSVEEKRVIVENKSLTTAQNAIYTYDILTSQYPEVSQIAIISSDYHIATGTLLFEAESILRADAADNGKLNVISNAAWKTPSGSLSTMFQAGALIELSGDEKTAFDIYYDNYDIHELPQIS